MFSLFKSKPSLKDLIPQGYVDIHSHLLYGLDDGAKTPADTKFIIESMVDLGFSQAIATPHTTPYVWDNTKEMILNKYEEAQRVLTAETEQVSLRVASEYMMDDSFLKRMEEEKLLTLKDNYVLVEMSYMNPPIQLNDILFYLKSNGYEIVLAHPERYNFYHDNLEFYARLKKMGCLFQINLLSVTGYYGNHVLEAANYLLKQEMYDFAGSDIHHEKHIRAFNAKVQIKNIPHFEQAMKNNKLFIA